MVCPEFGVKVHCQFCEICVVPLTVLVRCTCIARVTLMMLLESAGLRVPLRISVYALPLPSVTVRLRFVLVCVYEPVVAPPFGDVSVMLIWPLTISFCAQPRFVQLLNV